MRGTQEWLEMAREAGFDDAGVAPLRPPRAADRFRRWLDAGRHAGMAWLEEDRERLLDPRRILEGGRSLLVVAFGHARAPVEIPGGGRVVRYAAGRDYHNAVGKLLRKLLARMRREGTVDAGRSIVDAGPLLERSHAAEAGLGFESKSANLLHRHLGPWFFLGELIVDRELEPTPGPAPGSCGTCTACIDVCPTSAIVEPGVVDARLCISYHTIENRGAVPRELRAGLSGWLFGCDLCSEVCPFGSTATGGEERLGTHALVERNSLVDWLSTSDDPHRAELVGSPLQRAKREGLARNAALALAHHPSDAGVRALRAATEDDPSGLVRAAAGWSLAFAHAQDAQTMDVLERARARASDSAEARDLALSLEEAAARRPS